jgi:heparin/heparan-sulfate lyase
MVARTGWGAASVIAQMRVNIMNFVGHQHLDGGSFEIYYKGPLAIHSGVYQGVTGGYGSPHHSNFYQRTVAHNSLLVYDPDEKFTAGKRELGNDGGQRLAGDWTANYTIGEFQRGNYRTGTVEGHEIGGNYTYLKGDLTAAYSKKVREVKRSFVFLDLGGGVVPAAIVVFDRVVSTNPEFRKYWLLQSVSEPKVRSSQAIVSGRLVNTALLPAPDNLTTETIGGPGKEFWVFGKNYPNVTVPPDPEVGGWRVQLSPKQPAAEDLFLNVLQATDDGKPLPVRLRRQTAPVVTVEIADRVVLFNREGTRMTKPFTFEAQGQSTLKFLLTDLGEGNWQVWRGGQIVKPAIEVSAEAGTLYFEGPAGTYTLRR